MLLDDVLLEMMWVWVYRRVCMCLSVFYNGALGLGPGLLLCHTRLPHTLSHTHTHTNTRGLICDNATGKVIFQDHFKKLIDCQHTCILRATLLFHISQKMYKSQLGFGYMHRMCALRGILNEALQRDFCFFYTNKWPVHPSCRASPSLPFESQWCLCWWQPSRFSLSCVSI